jgi:glycosyltransferase involved in cell wall biosynthesis
MFPRLSETFILNEVLELEAQGVEVSATSLMLPNEGRFHGRLSELKLKVQNLPTDKTERYWEVLRALPAEHVAPFSAWDEAVAFMERFGQPKPLLTLLRAAIIGARARAAGVQHLHAHFGTIATRVAMLASMLSGIPYSFTAHAKDIFRATVDRALFAELVNRAAFCITVSDFNRRFILEKTPDADPDKVIRLYNGIDLGFFAPPAEPRPAPEVPHIISVGRLVPKKGFDHLLRALSLAKADGFAPRVTIVGGGEKEAELLALRAELGLQCQVTFTGALPQEQVRALLREATFMALACVPDPDGNMDALPTVMLEALAQDLPLVATTLTGLPEIVGDEAGLLVEPGDDPGLAKALATLWARIQAGEVQPGTSRARAERLFDLRANVAQLRGRFQASAAAGAE